MTINQPENTHTVALPLTDSLPEEYSRAVARAIAPLDFPVGQADTRVAAQSTEQDSRYHSLRSIWLEIQEPGPSIADLLVSVSFQWESTFRRIAAAAMFDIVSARMRENMSSPIETTAFVQSERALRRVPITLSPKLRMTREALSASALVAPSGTLLTWLEMIEEENNAAQ